MTWSRWWPKGVWAETSQDVEENNARTVEEKDGDDIEVVTSDSDDGYQSGLLEDYKDWCPFGLIIWFNDDFLPLHRCLS